MKKKELMKDTSSDVIANLEDNRTEISQEEYEAHLKEKTSVARTPIEDEVLAQINALKEQLLRAKEDKRSKEKEIANLEAQIVELELQDIGKIPPKYYKSKGTDLFYTAAYKTKYTKKNLADGYFYADIVTVYYGKTMDIYKVEYLVNERCCFPKGYSFANVYDEITEAEYNNIKKKAMDAIAK